MEDTVLNEIQQRLATIVTLLDKAETLTAQVESGEKSVAVLPAIRMHIETARKLAMQEIESFS
jgi:hypothetical protein